MVANTVAKTVAELKAYKLAKIINNVLQFLQLTSSPLSNLYVHSLPFLSPLTSLI